MMYFDDDTERERARRDAGERGRLSTRESDQLEELLRNVTIDRERVRDVMGFALDHAEEAKDVVEMISESLSQPDTPIPKKVARLFVVSDILYNSQQPIRNASAYRYIKIIFVPSSLPSLSSLPALVALL
jgi:U2-associated protein SR140